MSLPHRRNSAGLWIYGVHWCEKVENTSRCIEQIWPQERGAMPYQCKHKRGKGPDGLFCGIHAKFHKESK